MSDEAALLAAIRDNPDEDIPRLMYADWLDECAMTEVEAARAEFIRLQIQLASAGHAPLTIARSRLPTPPKGTGRSGRRVSELLANHGSVWCRWDWREHRYATEQVVCSWEWHRGFLWRLHCSPDDWLRCVDYVLPQHPIARVVLSATPVVHRMHSKKPIWLPGCRWLDPPSSTMDRHEEIAFLLATYWPQIKFEWPR